MTAPSHFDAVIQGLSRDQSLTRIKKLLLYLCSNRWENQSAQLDAVDLRYLVQEILKTTPAIEQLKARLNKVVKTINKPAEYALVANAIVDHLKPLYTQGQETTQVISPNNYYTATTTRLEQDPQNIRIRKILFCACNGRWENDLNILDRYPLNSLVERLHTLTPSLEELQAVLFSIVKTLNRQSEYTLVANSVLEAFTPLYIPAADSTRILFVPELEHSQPSTPVAPVSIAQSRPTQRTQQIDLTPSPEENSQDQVELPKEPPDRFDLRLEVMKYTSPLRAKALLFSMLYRSIDATSEGWSVVRSHDLDELLHATLDTYTNYTDLEAALKNTAKTLNDSKPYLQSAGAVLRAVRSWYDYTESVEVSGNKGNSSNLDSSSAQSNSAQSGSAQSSSAQSSNAGVSNVPTATSQPSISAASSTSQPPTAPVNLRPAKAKQPILAEGDRTLDLAPSSIHQDNTLPMPDPPGSIPLSQGAEDTGFFGDLSEQP